MLRRLATGIVAINLVDQLVDVAVDSSQDCIVRLSNAPMGPPVARPAAAPAEFGASQPHDETHAGDREQPLALPQLIRKLGRATASTLTLGDRAFIS
ncbi:MULTISPECIES: hypothetical protein [unclassified Bosea (in: a-proteobacteria)]|nr:MULTISPECIES: hypothetical protein [unclassified Bosea (in: a-proteobacteria)]